MTARIDLIHYLRDRIIGELHVGQLSGGDRLPSIRELGKELGKNTRTVKAAYAALEREGLVEVRGRSGVFVARHEIGSGDRPEETTRWLSDVVAEAWKRRVSVGALPGVIQRSTRARPVVCGLVDEAIDSIVALRHELEHEWGFAVRVLAPDALEHATDIDFFAGTSFHAPRIHAAVEALGKPLIALTVNAGLKEAVESRIRQGRLTVVAVDGRFAERIRVIYAAHDPSIVRFVNASDTNELAALSRSEPVMVTRAAHERIGEIDLPMIFPHSPTISMESARALAGLLVRANLEQIPG
jgi:DNA-binding transcriptional regulator YhcF (GntR family)